MQPTSRRFPNGETHSKEEYHAAVKAVRSKLGEVKHLSTQWKGKQATFPVYTVLCMVEKPENFKTEENTPQEQEDKEKLRQEELEHLRDVLHREGGQAVIDILDTFKIISHSEIAKILAASRTDKGGEALMKNFSKFKGLDHNEIARCLIWGNQTDILAQYISSFKGLDYNEILNEALNAITTIPVEKILEHLSNFEGLDHNDFARRLCHSRYKNRYLAKYLPNFEGLDHNEIAKIFIKKAAEGEEEAGEILIEYLPNFKVDHNEIAKTFIKEGVYKTLIKNFSRFEGLNCNTITLEIIKKAGTGVFLNDLLPHFKEREISGNFAKHLVSFIESDAKSEEDKRTLIESVMRYHNRFDSIDSETAKKIISLYGIDDIATFVRLPRMEGNRLTRRPRREDKLKEFSFEVLDFLMQYTDTSQRPTIKREMLAFAKEEIEKGNFEYIFTDLDHFFPFTDYPLREEEYIDLAEMAFVIAIRDGVDQDRLEKMRKDILPDFTMDDMSAMIERQYHSYINEKRWELVLFLPDRFPECQPIFQEFFAKQREISKDDTLPMSERQEAFHILSELAKNGESTVSKEFVDIITKRSKQSEVTPDSRLGLDPLQESAFYTLMLLDNAESNAALFGLLSQENVHNDIKHAVLRKLLREDSSFLHKDIKNVLRHWFYANPEKEVDWNDLQFLDAVQKIPSNDLRKSALKSFSVLQELTPSFQLYGDWKEHLNDIPKNLFIQLFHLCGDGGVWWKFQDLFSGIRENRKKESLLYGITKVLEIEPQILSLLVEKLQEIHFGEGDEDALSEMLRQVTFLDSIKNIQQNNRYDDDDYYDDYDDDDAYDDDTTYESQKPEKSALQKIFSRRTRNLSELVALTKEASTRMFQEVLPHQDITGEKVEAIEEQWGNLEPIFTYLGRFPSLKRYTAEIVAHIDQWKEWRYSKKQRRGVERQIGHLSKEELAIWKDDYFAEIGEVMAADTASEKPKRIRQFLQDAIVRDRHIANPEEGHTDDQFIQDTLQKTFEKIAQEPNQQEAIVTEALNEVQPLAEHLDAIVEHNNLQRLEYGISLLSKDIKPSSKTKNTVGFIANYLPSDLQKECKERYAAQQTPLTQEMQDILDSKAEEMKEKYQDALNSSIWDTLNLDKNNLKNLKQFYQKRQEIKSIVDILNLYALTNKKIAMNRITDKDKKSGGEAITTTLDRLKKHFGEKKNKKGEVTEPASPFFQDLTNIETALREKADLSEKRRLAMLFTDNPQILWQVGKYPLGSGSCQHYAQGSYARNLMGYVGDPNCKAAYVIDLNKLPQDIKDTINEHGFEEVKDTIHAQDLLEASVSRMMIKMARDSQDNPVVLLEPSYGSRDMNNYFNLFVDLMVAEPMQATMARDGGNKRITVGRSISPEGQYEDTNLSGVKFITKHTKQTKEEQQATERIRRSR